jgi:thioredoxin-related protein
MWMMSWRHAVAMSGFVAAILFGAPERQAAAADAAGLPALSGRSEPRVVPLKGDDGLYHQSWFVQSFLDLKEDHAEAKSNRRRFAVIFEQRGCIYCTKMHTEVLAHRYINDYVRENFSIVQLDMWGSREVTDFDGTKTIEKKLAERWGILFTPTVVFFKDDFSGASGTWGPPLEVARLPLGFGPATFIDLFVWIKGEVYKTDPNFQRFHIARMAERAALEARNEAAGAKRERR